MKIKLHSDLHHEFLPPGVPPRFETFDSQMDTVLVLAGDINAKTVDLVTYIRDMAGYFKAVVAVAGNHEYYGNSVENVNNVLTELDDELGNFHFLLDKSVEIEGYRFIGSTMWTSFKDGNPLIMNMAQYRMNDYVKITYKGCTLTTNDVFEWHQKSLEFMLDELKSAQQAGVQTIIVNHHSPSWQLVDADYRHEGEINYCYYNDFDAIMEEYKPLLWMYGHTHASVDRMIHDTRVVANPYGYFNYSENPNWDKDKLIEI